MNCQTSNGSPWWFGCFVTHHLTLLAYYCHQDLVALAPQVWMYHVSFVHWLNCCAKCSKWWFKLGCCYHLQPRCLLHFASLQVTPALDNWEYKAARKCRCTAIILKTYVHVSFQGSCIQYLVDWQGSSWRVLLINSALQDWGTAACPAWPFEDKTRNRFMHTQMFGHAVTFWK